MVTVVKEVEKIVERPVEVIKEVVKVVEKPVEVIREVIVEKKVQLPPVEIVKEVHSKKDQEKIAAQSKQIAQLQDQIFDLQKKQSLTDNSMQKSKSQVDISKQSALQKSKSSTSLND